MTRRGGLICLAASGMRSALLAIEMVGRSSDQPGVARRLRSSAGRPRSWFLGAAALGRLAGASHHPGPRIAARDPHDRFPLGPLWLAGARRLALAAPHRWWASREPDQPPA